MKCRTFLDLISPYLDGRLSAGERDVFDAHRQQCPDCGSALERQSRMEDVARQVTDITPRPGFHDAVLARIDRETPQVAPPLAAPRSNRSGFRVPGWVAAAGLILGLVTGMFAMPLLSPSGSSSAARDQNDGENQSPWGEVRDLSDTKAMRQARDNVGEFLQASEAVGSGINVLDWSDPMPNAIVLRDILRGIEMEDKLRRAEAARPVLSRYNPQASTALSELFEDQRVIIDQVRQPKAVSSDVAARMQARALNVLDAIDRLRRELGVRIEIRLEPSRPSGPEAGTFGKKKDVEVLLSALDKEIRGDLPGAAAIYRVFPEAYPDSRWKIFTVDRGVRVAREIGQDHMALQFLRSLEKIVKPGELNAFTAMRLKGMLARLDSVDSDEKIELRVKIDSLWRSQKRFRLDHIKGLKVNGLDVPVSPKVRGLVLHLYNTLRHDSRNWSSQHLTIHASGMPAINKVVFERFGKRSPTIAILLSPLLEKVDNAPKPGDITRVEIEGY